MAALFKTNSFMKAMIDFFLASLTLNIIIWIFYFFALYKKDHWNSDNKPKTLLALLGTYSVIVISYMIIQFLW